LEFAHVRLANFRVYRTNADWSIIHQRCTAFYIEDLMIWCIFESFDA
jgi:hypothetical protein